MLEMPDTHLYSELKGGWMHHDSALGQTRKFGMDFREAAFVLPLFSPNLFLALNHYF